MTEGSMAKVIMIQGTMSNVGKSILAGGLCRVLKQDGLRVAPFKSQNMALNSYITRDGMEMGRAQVMQAEAAGIEPSVDMNPILLKPSSDTGSQVIVNGKVWRQMSAAEYYRNKQSLIPEIRAAYDRLAGKYDVIVIEGAGSPAEINLREHDIVNMGMAQMVDAPVLLAGDIDRGGVFAQLAGTMMLLDPGERERVKAVIINKFRGDVSILRPGLSMLTEKIGVPVCGIVPYTMFDIDEEDSLTKRFEKKERAGLADVAVIRLPRISNFTDLAPLESIPEIDVRYVNTSGQLKEPDAVIIPGSKNTIEDLLWLRQSGLESRIIRFAKRGGVVLGICGGYQMLGHTLSDPAHTECGMTVDGMGLLPIRTVFSTTKKTIRVRGNIGAIGGVLTEMAGKAVDGYEIHMGTTTPTEESGSTPFSYLTPLSGQSHERNAKEPDGRCSGNVYGTYVHGLFDTDEAARSFAEALLRKKGIEIGSLSLPDRNTYKQEQYDLLADVVRRSLNMDMIYGMIEKGNRYS